MDRKTSKDAKDAFFIINAQNIFYVLIFNFTIFNSVAWHALWMKLMCSEALYMFMASKKHIQNKIIVAA